MNEGTHIAGERATGPLESPPIDIDAQSPVAQQDDAGGLRWLETLAKPRFAIPTLTIFSALLFLVNLGNYPLYTKGESREAVTILDIVSGGGVILPMRAGVEIPSKPLLMHWIAAMLSILAGGVNELTVRLPSALFAMAGVLACYYYVRKLFNPRAALIAALILGTTIQYLQAGTGARVDMTLTFFMEVAFFEFLLIGEGLVAGRTLLYVAIAMAVLTKGPVGAVLPAAVAMVWIATQWRWSLVRDLRLARGAVIVAVLAGWWYIAASIIGGEAFIQKQLIAENFVRFFGASNFQEGHVHGFYYLDLALLGGLLPWTPLLALVFLRALRAPRQMDPRLTYLLIWFLVVLGFYSVSHSKRGVYLMSLYPALATMMALYIVDAIDQPRASAWLVKFLSSIYGAVLAAAGILALIAIAMLWLRPLALASIFDRFEITNPDFVTALRAAVSAKFALSAMIPLATLALGAFLMRTSKRAHKMALAIAAGMGLIAIAANAVVSPAIANTLALKDFTGSVLRTVDGHPLGYVVGLDYTVAFYSRRNFPIVRYKDEDKPEYLLCWEDFWEQVPADLREQYQPVITSNPTQLDGSGRMVLLKKVTPSSSPSSSDISV